MKQRQPFGPTAGDKRRSNQRFASWVLALLCLAAAVLMVLHLRPDSSVPAYALKSPQVASCSVAPLDSFGTVPYEMAEDAVRVNLAGVDELMVIPGVGPVLAQAIIDERLAHGFFYYPEDLLCVKGIGEKTLQKLLPYVNLN